MSHNKAILAGKEKRKPYRHAKRVDATCRNHGGCPQCTKNRLFKKQLGKGKPASATRDILFSLSWCN